MRLIVGIVSKAQGIKGELNVNCLLDNAHQLKGIKTLYLANNAHKVAKFRCDNSSFVVQFDDILDRNKAESYKGWEVYADKEDIALAEDSYFVADLIGCNVLCDDGTKLGIVVDIAQYGSADVYTVATDKGEVSFPWLKSIISCVDIANKRIVLIADKLQEVIVYQYEN